MGRKSKAAKERQQRRRGGTRRTRPDKGRGAPPKSNNLTAIVREADSYLSASRAVLKASGFEGSMRQFVKAGALPDGHKTFSAFFHSVRGTEPEKVKGKAK